MKRINGKIDYNETGVYKINDVLERYHYDWFKTGEAVWVKVLNLSSYQICNVYTNKGAALSAYLSLNGPESVYKVVMDEKEQRLTRPKRKTILSQIVSNHRFNCHGYTFLDSMFWFELNAKKIQILIEEDKYVPCIKEDLKEGGICVYYESNGRLLHSGAMRDGQIRSKFGINKTMTLGEEDILKRYRKLDHSKTRYYNPS